MVSLIILNNIRLLGRKLDIEIIWSELTDGSFPCVKEQQIPLLLSKLDDVAIQTELEMERERSVLMSDAYVDSFVMDNLTDIFCLLYHLADSHGS